MVILNSVSRDKSLKIPKELELVTREVNLKEDYAAVKEAIYTYENKRFNKDEVEQKIDNELEVINKIPTNANELMVITVVKKLCAYTMCVTEKSPKKFRGVFVNRMHNYLLDTLEFLLEANFTRMNSDLKKKKREQLQQNAIIKLKMLGYVAMLSSNVNCILPKQYKQISMQAAYAINLVAAWKKSDDLRWKKTK